MKAARKQWADRNKERLAELQRDRRSNPETYQSELAANAAAKRLKRRLTAAGLPPKQLHPATAAERRGNERAAAAYFSDPNLPEHLRQITVFSEALTAHMLKSGSQMREFAKAYAATRARVGLPPVPAEDIAYARAVEIVIGELRRTDLLTSRDVAASVRSTKAVIRRQERKHKLEWLVKTVVAEVQRNRDRYVADAELENRARTHRGKSCVPLEPLVVQLALHTVLERVPASGLTVDDARRAARVVRLRIDISAQPRFNAVDERVWRRPVGPT